MAAVHSALGPSEVLFYSAAPRPEDEATRQNAVYTSNAMICVGDERLRALAQKAADTVGTRMAAISVIDGDTHRFLATVGFDAEEMPRATSLCAHTVQTQSGRLVIANLAADQRFAGNPLVLSTPFLRSYVGTAVRGPGGHHIGALCALGEENLSDISKGMLIDLADLAVQAEAILADCASASSFRAA